MLIQLINHKEVNTVDEKCKEGLNIFMFYFILFFLLHWKDQLKSLYNFYDRIFVTALLFELFNFIRFENDTTSDIILHNERLLDCCFCSI